MPYRLIVGESVQDGIRRILSEQIEQSLRELADSTPDRSATIHQVRKRCKEIRAALRLVRGALGEAYTRENVWYRDAARCISDLRDTEAMVETYDGLAEHFVGRPDMECTLPVRDWLVAQKRNLMEDPGRVERLLLDFESAMMAGYQRVPTLTVEGGGHEAVLAGARTSYSQARAAMAVALDHPTTETFHEWRKRVKDHWYHMRLMRGVWPPVMRVWEDEADKLGELLGDYHNLCVLQLWLADGRVSSVGKEVLGTLSKLVEKRITQLERGCQPLGRRLFAERPKHWARRFASYFRVWADGN